MDSTPFAVPYPWTVSEKQATRMASSTTTVSSRKRKGSGFWYLESRLSATGNRSTRMNQHHHHHDDDDDHDHDDHDEDNNKMSDRAKRILKELLSRNAVAGHYQNDEDEDDDEMPQSDHHDHRHGDARTTTTTTTTSTIRGTMSQFQSSNFYLSPRIPEVPTEDDYDDEAAIISLAQEGHTSLLLHIVKTMDELQIQQEDAGMISNDVTAKAIIRNCALSVNPCTTPGALDAKEMVLAALQFLCSDAQLRTNCGPTTTTSTTDQDIMITLPLLEATNPNDDADKRTYHKVGDWTWTDFKTEAFGELQLLFDSSPIRREAFVPRFLSDRDEIPLLQRGLIPPSAAPKRKGPAPGYRRNTSSSTTTTNPAPHRPSSTTNKSDPSPSPTSSR